MSVCHASLTRRHSTDNLATGWYTEATPNNRMLLSLRSGIDSEIGWALDRLCRLCDNEQFLLKAIPGLTDALFEWPEWYATTGCKQTSEMAILFSPLPLHERQRRHALESLFILRNAALNDPNAFELANHPRTRPLILKILRNLEYDVDDNAEFLLHACELLQAVAHTLVLPSDLSLPDPLPTLENIIRQSSNRSLIIAALTSLTLIFSNPSNVIHLSADSPSFQASIRYLPLFKDKPLLEACLNYLYAHLSSPAMAKSLLLQPEMPSILRLMVSLLLSEQVEEIVSLDIGGVVPIAPALSPSTRDHELTEEELEILLEKPEPQRCYEWCALRLFCLSWSLTGLHFRMKTMFVAKTEGEVTQVDFWNLYKDAFTPHQDRRPLLVASDVIKNVTVVFGQAQAMVLPGTPQRFVVRGVDRRKDDVIVERFKCQWDRSQCTQASFKHPGQLYEHVLEHVSASEDAQMPCLWSSCRTLPMPKASLRAHILTHLSTTQPPAKHPSQSDTITLPTDLVEYPTEDPTQRPPPFPRNTTITYRRPVVDPPSSSLTALLCIRILFRASFASSDMAPRVDADHFGFPGVIEDTEDPDGEDDRDGSAIDSEKEGERRGRKAFSGVRHLMEGVRIKDETLMGWIMEMVDAGGVAGVS